MKAKTKKIIAVILITLVIGIFFILGYWIGHLVGETKVIEINNNCLNKCYSLTCFRTCSLYELTDHMVVKIK